MSMFLGVSAPVLMMDAGAESVSLVLALPDAEVANWPRVHAPAADDASSVAIARTLLAEHGLKRPDLTLVCGMGRHSEEEKSHAGRAARMARWREALRVTGGKAEFFLKESLPGWEVSSLCDAAREAFGSVLGTDSGMASVLSALSIESLRDRSWNEGVAVVHADELHTQAFMLFREKLLGLYENHADLDRDSLLADLKEVRLNWLPDEKVRAAGGHGCICGDFPAEAEGFRPTWILGTKRDLLSGAGRLASPCGDARFDRCFGLLYGYTLQKESSQA